MPEITLNVAIVVTAFLFLYAMAIGQWHYMQRIYVSTNKMAVVTVTVRDPFHNKVTFSAPPNHSIPKYPTHESHTRTTYRQRTVYVNFPKWT